MGYIVQCRCCAIVGTWLIPAIIGWAKAKRQHKTLRFYRKVIASLNNSKSENDQVEQKTSDELNNDVTSAYSRGEVNELQYEILKDEILLYNQKKISETIDSLKNVSA